MPRVKQVPVKSLEEIDYSHPSMLIWFFGHPPTNTKTKHIELPTYRELDAETIPSDAKKLKPASMNGSSDHAKVELKPSDDKKSPKHLAHPLSSQPDVPALTDLQVFMTEAIITSEAKSCSFEAIYDYVSKRWRSIKRRDGSNYTTDCRRAIRANLRQNPNHVALFRKDDNRDGWWTICSTMEEANTARERALEKQKSRKSNERERLLKDHDITKTSMEDDEEGDEEKEDRSRRATRKVAKESKEEIEDGKKKNKNEDEEDDEEDDEEEDDEEDSRKRKALKKRANQMVQAFNRARRVKEQDQKQDEEDNEEGSEEDRESDEEQEAPKSNTRPKARPPAKKPKKDNNNKKETEDPSSEEEKSNAKPVENMKEESEEDTTKKPAKNGSARKEPEVKVEEGTDLSKSGQENMSVSEREAFGDEKEDSDDSTASAPQAKADDKKKKQAKVVSNTVMAKAVEDVKRQLEDSMRRKKAKNGKDDGKSDALDGIQYKLTEVQEIMIECICMHGGACPFGLLLPYISKNIKKKKNITTDDIVDALTDGAIPKLFCREKKTGWWSVSPVYLPDNMVVKSEPTEDQDKKKKGGKSRATDDDDEKSLTQLQILIIQAIQQAGGAANFDQILDYVQPSFDSLRRRDGSPYTSECRRALLASLSNNPASKPFFRKEKKDGANVWALAKRSLEYLEAMKKDPDTEGKTFSPETNGAAEVEEEILDEEEGEGENQVVS